MIIALLIKLLSPYVANVLLSIRKKTPPANIADIIDKTILFNGPFFL